MYILLALKSLKQHALLQCRQDSCLMHKTAFFPDLLLSPLISGLVVFLVVAWWLVVVRRVVEDIQWLLVMGRVVEDSRWLLVVGRVVEDGRSIGSGSYPRL